MVKRTMKKEHEPDMEARLRKYFTLALVVFVIVNILALVLVLNAYLSNAGNVTSLLSTISPSTGTQKGSTTTPTSSGIVAEITPVVIISPALLDGESIFVHLKPNNSACTIKVANILEENRLTLDKEVSNPTDSDDLEMGFLAIKKNASTASQINTALTAVKRLALNCLDTKPGLVPSGGTLSPAGSSIVQNAPPKNDILYFDDDEEDEEDWIEYDSLGGPQLGQSVPYIGADIVNKPTSLGGLGIDGNSVDVCVIDTGIEEGYFQGVQFVIIPNSALPLVVNGFNPKPGPGLKTEYNPADLDVKFKNPGIIDDEDNIVGHGTVMAGIISSNSPVSGSGIFIKSPGVSPKINLMVAKLPNMLSSGATFKASKTDFLKALKFCLGKNRTQRKADVVFTGFSFNDVLEKSTESFDLFSEKWQVMGEKNPMDKKQKGESSNNIKSVVKVWDKFGKASKKPKKTDPYTIPFVVPVGNNVGGASENGVPNSLALLDFSVGVGSVFDDVGLPSYGGGDSLPTTGSHSCSDSTTAKGKVLCDTSCQINGAGQSAVTVVAPGYHIFAPSVGDGPTGPHTGYVSGTSAAAAHVAGVIALMKQASPSSTVTVIKSILQSTSTKTDAGGTYLWTAYGVSQTCYGGGVVDALKAVQTAQSG